MRLPLAPMIEWLQHVDLEVVNSHGREDLSEWLFWTYAGISAALVAMAGLMSGLTLGLMSLDEIDLEVLRRSGTEQEKRHARRIMPVIANEHMLLVTLLLFNALSTEALPIFLDRLVDPITAVVLSVTVVLVIGEILPQAVCRSFGLQVGSYSAWFVRLLMILSSPVSWPIGKLIDWLLGEEHTALFRRAQLKALVGLHSTDEGLGGNLTADEISIITGALDLTSKTAWTAMTPLDKVFMLASDRVLDEATLQEILISGHSRIPVYEPNHRRQLVGLILVKELVLVDPEQGLTAGQLVSRQLPRLPADTPMYQLLRLFEAGGSHMVALTKPPIRRSNEVLSPHYSGVVLSPAGKQGSGPLGLTRTPTASGNLAAALPHILSGIIQVGDKEIYLETQQQGSEGAVLSPRGGGLGQQGVDGVLGHQGSGSGLTPRSGGVQGLDDDELWGSGQEGDPVGIITIEDVIEELLQQEIIDETDQYVDNMQNMRVDAYALTTNLPPRLRKAYHQQFTPRVGRLVAHHQHYHPVHSHAGAGSWPRGDMSQQWMHMTQGIRPLYEGRVAVSNPATPLAGSPPNQHHNHPALLLPTATTAGGSVLDVPCDTPQSSSRFSSETSGQFRYYLGGVMSPEHAQPDNTQQQQQQQARHHWQQYDILHPDYQLQQQHNATQQGYDQAVIRRSSGDGAGYVTYNIFSLPKRRSNETGQQSGQQSGRTTPEGSTHGGRLALHHLEGSVHRSQPLAPHFRAVREGLMEGYSPSAAAAELAAAAAAAARDFTSGSSGADYDPGSGMPASSSPRAVGNEASSGVAGGLDDLREPLLPKESDLL